MRVLGYRRVFGTYCGHLDRMHINLAAMSMNLGFNWLLIDGNLGCPALGLEGAAWASVTATITAFTVFLVVFLLDRRGRAGSPCRGENANAC